MDRISATPAEGAFGIIRKQLPEFLKEKHAEDLVDVVSTFVPQDLVDVGLGLATGPFGKATRLGGLALAGMGYAPEVEAGTLSAVKKLLDSEMLREAAERLFSKFPSVASYSDPAIAKALSSGADIRGMSADQYHRATFPLGFRGHSAAAGDRGQMDMLRGLARSGDIDEIPRMTVGKGAHNQYYFIDHDGRHRMQAVQEAWPDQNLPVVINYDSVVKSPSRVKKPVYPQIADKYAYDYRLGDLEDRYYDDLLYLNELPKP